MTPPLFFLFEAFGRVASLGRYSGVEDVAVRHQQLPADGVRACRIQEEAVTIDAPTQ